MDENQASFNGWAKVEVMGHQSHIGHVTTEAYGGTVLFRIDSPGLREEEQTLDQSEWIGDQRVPAGSVVKVPAIPPFTVLVGAGSIYRIVPCTEDAAMKAIRTTQRRPLMVIKLAEAPAIESSSAERCENCGELEINCTCPF
jgi:hypothetical protein